MSPVEALRRPLQEDLSGFVDLLRRLQVPHRVSEERGAQVLWVPSQPLAEQVRALYLSYPQGAAEEQIPTPARPSRPGLVVQLRVSWMTTLVLLLTLVVAGVTLLGDNFAALRWLTFQEFQIQGEYLYFQPWTASLAAGQWWRLWSPALLHFGVLHLAMNSLWIWELGRRVEWRQGGLVLLMLVLSYSLVSNIGQYVWSGPSLFGGLSGVLYGLLGHCWIYQKLAPNPLYRLPPGVVGMMLIWLLVCMTGIFELVQLATIANAAHVAGLLAGCCTGLLGGALARSRQ